MLIISFFSGEASDNSLNKNAGLKFAKRFNSFLRVNNAFSGRSSQSKLSHCVPPTAPNSIASDSLAALRTSFGKGDPHSLNAVPPTFIDFTEKSRPYSFIRKSKTSTAEAVTS